MSLSELQKRKLMKLFRMYDAKNLGTLDISDFEELAQRLADLRGWKPDTSKYEENLRQYILLQWCRIWAFIQKKLHLSTSDISLEDWLDYYDMVLNNETYQIELMLLPEAILNVVDVDGNGYVDRSKWADLFHVHNIPVFDVEEAFNRIDLDKDGILKKEEVLSMIQEFYFSNDPNAAGNYMFGPI